MTDTPAVEAYWRTYIKAHPEAAELYDSEWSFGDNPRLANELLELVLKGIKTGTASDYDLNEIRGLTQPFAHGHSILLDASGEPRAIIETIKVEVIPFDKVTAEFAYSEGEDDRSLESWRYNHELYFTRERKAYGKPFELQMKVVCENFQIVDIRQLQ